MWRFKPFMPKEPTGLEGRCIDIGDIKIQVKNAIAEGGFSCVYLARDAVNASKQYAVKHMICNDEESLELVMKEISVMKVLRGHPNVVTLYSHTILDMGRTKEALLVMEFCEKSLVSVLESRGAGYFLEDQVLLIFRDVCNAVFAMHCQSPPIAHRDLKAENLLLGSDGLWKLCDFGSTSTNHKRFVKPEEMGVEEDVIRKHTTPAYRAPEMWDLFRRDLINEKVDIWALGCLLYRICYFKSAFDGESKLQVLNGNYRIPDAPKYSTAVIDLIRDMLQISPDHRPDVTQVWFRVNQQSPMGQQKSLPDRPSESRQGIPERDEGISKLTVKSAMAPRSSPTPTTSINTTQKVSPQNASRSGASEPAGSFWSSPHAEDSILGENNGAPKFDQEIDNYSTSKQDRPRLAQHHLSGKTSPSRDLNQRIGPAESLSKSRDRYSKDSVTRSSQADKLKPDRTANFENEAFNTFVAEFDTSRLNAGVSNNFGKQSLEAEVERLKDQLKQVNLEKSEVTSRYEKLSAICRSQRQEILELKQAVGARFPSPGNSILRTHSSPIIQASVTSQVDGTAQQGFIGRVSPNPEAKTWKAFSDDPSPLTSMNNDAPQPVRTQKAQPRTQSVPARFGDSKWGFETDSFTATHGSTSRLPKPGEKINFKPSWDSNKGESKQASQPAGWAGF